MIFLIRSAQRDPSSGKLRAPATWRWLYTYDSEGTDVPRLTPGWSARYQGGVVKVTSLASWLVEWEERRRIAKAKLQRGEDATV